MPKQTWTDDLRARWDELLDEHREAMLATLDGLSEEEARRRLVPSKTTLMGLIKHLTYVERTWFDQAVTGRTYQEMKVAATTDGSFNLRKGDTIESVSATFREACEDSRDNVSGLALDDEVDGRGGHTVWSLYVQMLRELHHHNGHADILREQILAARDD